MNNNQKSILVWDTSSHPPKGYNNVYLWNSFDLESYPDAISLPKIIDKEADELKNEYLSIIHDLGNYKVDGRRIIEIMNIYDNYNAKEAHINSPQPVWSTPHIFR